MTERVEKIEVEKRIFVADDGTEFQTEKDCRQYEQDCAERNAKFIVAKLPHFTCSPQWIDPDFAWNWPLSGRLSSIRMPAHRSIHRRHTHAGLPVPLTATDMEVSRER